MGAIITTFIVGIGLSMDAFSLSLVYGTQGISKSNKILLSLIVGLFHFFMPLFGSLFGSIILSYCNFNINVFISIIFGFIGIDMIISGIKEEEVNISFGIVGYLMFGLSVSIDSFTTGIGFSLINNNSILVSFIFMLCSGIFTYLGLLIGNYLNKRLGNYANILGGLIFLFLVLYYLF